MDRIEQQPEGFRLLAHKILLWITYARQELSLRELQEAVVVESDITEIDPDADLVEAELLASFCAGIVIIDQRAGLVRLVHYTTQEYLEKVRQQRLPPEECLASTCLTRLQMASNVPILGSYERHLYTMIHRHPFLEYAGKSWGWHMPLASSAQLLSVIEGVLLDGKSLRLVAHLLLGSRRDATGEYECPISGVSPLHICAYFGLLELTQRMIRRTTDLNAVVSVARPPPTSYSAVLRHIIHYSTKGVSNRTPLSWAAEYGHEQIVATLLAQRGVMANIIDDFGRSPLSWAAGNGHIGTTELFVAHEGANINLPDWRSGTPLHRAAGHGHTEVVKILLGQPEVNVNILDNRGRTPLLLAAENGHTGVVSLLAEAEAKNSS